MLALGVLFLVAIDIVILVVFTAVEGSKTDVSGDSEIAAKQVINRENPDDLEGVSKYHTIALTLIQNQMLFLYIYNL